MKPAQLLRGFVKAAARLVPAEGRQRLRRSRLLAPVFTRLDASMPASLTLGDGRVWRRAPNCPDTLLDAGGAQIGDRLYVICGMISPDAVSDRIQVFDLKRRRWTKTIKVPAELPHSHLAVADDGRRIFIAGGQHGGQCRPAVASVFCLDTESGAWTRLPDLPDPRYAGAMRHWRGALHFVGGAAEDRYTPTADHWRLPLTGAEAAAEGWEALTPAPAAAMHRAMLAIDDRLFLFGGQQGDFTPIPGDPRCTCTGATRETYEKGVFRLNEPAGEWDRCADMPIPASHTEFSTVVDGGTALLFGGQIYKDPDTFHLRLTEAVQAYDTATDRWSAPATLPYPMKTPVVGWRDGEAFITCGQRAGRNTNRPGPINALSWTTRIEGAGVAVADRAPLPCLAGKSVLLVSHILDRSGAPLELLELAAAMTQSGAAVRLVNLAGDGAPSQVAAAHHAPVIARESAVAHAATADLVVANTAHASVKDWVQAALAVTPCVADRLVWMVHEIDIGDYGDRLDELGRARLTTFDSRACRDVWVAAGLQARASRVIHPGLTAAQFARSADAAPPFSPATDHPEPARPRALTRAEARARLGLRADDVLVASVGSVSPRKGQDMLLKTVARLADERGLPLKLMLVGFRSSAERRRFLADLTAPERAVITPRRAFLPTPHLAALYLASDAHVLNSQGVDGAGECFGRATVEAMASGLPVFATDAGGAPEIIENGVEGYLHPTGAAGQAMLADHLVDLVADPKARIAMGAAARRRAESDFTKDRYLREMNEALAPLLVGGAAVDAA